MSRVPFESETECENYVLMVNLISHSTDRNVNIMLIVFLLSLMIKLSKNCIIM